MNIEKKNYLKAINILESTNLNKKDFNRNAIKYEILAQSYDSVGKYDLAFNYFVESNNIFKNVYEIEIDKKMVADKMIKINFFNLIDKYFDI